MQVYRQKIGTLSNLVALAVAIDGLLIIAQTLIGQLRLRHVLAQPHNIGITVYLPLLLGLSLLYVSIYLRRRKRNAWMFVTGLYIFLIGLNTNDLFIYKTRLFSYHHISLLLPVVILIILLLLRKDYIVRSDIRSFTNSLKVSVLILVVALLYGIGGFLLMDNHDFHHEISLPTAVHYTIDQFDLTVNPLHAYSKRANIFLDSLSFISVTAVGLVFVSLFQPLRIRLSSQKSKRELARSLIYKYPSDSEDYFKLWPKDKTYYFNRNEQSGLAYKVQGGVALIVGNPYGLKTTFNKLLNDFEELCFVNDWRPAFIHTNSTYKDFFKERGYITQLIGQEAIVDIEKFCNEYINTKYFREISNRFKKLGYTSELLIPPHNTAIINRLKLISNDWLDKPGRVERQFMMGYFSIEYLQECALFVVRDKTNTIQAFLNLLPSPITEESDFDLLRSSKNAPGNIIDFTLIQLIENLRLSGTKRLNMGLCPLTGIEHEPNSLINRTLRFVYSNGNRFYSFTGLFRFKEKYHPNWSDRYIVYKGGITDLTRIMRSLMKAMSK
jgi:phosphatidylglycerol lysyltransferase